MKLSTAILTAALLLIGRLDGLAQGFINLNFEGATIVTDPSGYFPSSVYASNAIPGWTGYINGTPQTDIIYNEQTLGAAMVGLEGTNNSPGFPAIQGKYLIYLKGSSEGYPSSAAIGQTGQIPANALSLIFRGLASGPATVSFNGQVLPLTALNNIPTGNLFIPNYAIYAADISGYAGQSGQLLFTGLGGYALDPYSIGGFVLDSIQFSNTAVPEPSQLALVALGTLLLGFRRWEK